MSASFSEFSLLQVRPHQRQKQVIVFISEDDIGERDMLFAAAYFNYTSYRFNPRDIRSVTHAVLTLQNETFIVVAFGTYATLANAVRFASTEHLHCQGIVLMVRETRMSVWEWIKCRFDDQIGTLKEAVESSPRKILVVGDEDEITMALKNNKRTFDVQDSQSTFVFGEIQTYVKDCFSLTHG